MGREAKEQEGVYGTSSGGFIIPHKSSFSALNLSRRTPCVTARNGSLRKMRSGLPITRPLAACRTCSVPLYAYQKEKSPRERSGQVARRNVTHRCDQRFGLPRKPIA